MGILASKFKEFFPERQNVTIGYQRADEDRLSKFIFKHFLRGDKLTLEGANMKLTVSKDGECIEIPLKIAYPSQSGVNLKELVGDQIYNEHKFMHITFSVTEELPTDERTTNSSLITEISGLKRTGGKKELNAKPSVEILSSNWLDEVRKYKSITIHSTSGCENICDAIRNWIPNTVKVLKNTVEIKRTNKSYEVISGVDEAARGVTQITSSVDADTSDVLETESWVDESSSDFIDTPCVGDETDADIDNGTGTVGEPDKCMNIVVMLKRTRIQSDADSAIEQTMLTEEMKKRTILLIFHKIIGSKTVDDVSSIMYRNEDVFKTFNVPYRINE